MAGKIQRRRSYPLGRAALFQGLRTVARVLPRPGLSGHLGHALFQSIYQPATGLLSALPMMPEWYVVVAALAGLSLLGLEWSPLLIAWPLLFVAMTVPFVHAVFCGFRARFATVPESRRERLKMHALTAYLHMVQPLARLYGPRPAGSHPLAPMRGDRSFAPWPSPKTFNLWSETWRSSIDWLESLEASIKGCAPWSCEAGITTGGIWNCAAACWAVSGCSWRWKNTGRETVGAVPHLAAMFRRRHYPDPALRGPFGLRRRESGLDRLRRAEYRRLPLHDAHLQRMRLGHDRRHDRAAPARNEEGIASSA